jgi:hypothetical protein
MYRDLWILYIQINETIPGDIMYFMPRGVRGEFSFVASITAIISLSIQFATDEVCYACFFSFPVSHVLA